MTRLAKRTLVCLAMVGALSAGFAPHAGAETNTGGLCVRLDIWVPPLTYISHCVSNPSWPTVPKA